MKNSNSTSEERKAKKAAYDKAYRERKRLGIVGRPVDEVVPAQVVKQKKEKKQEATAEAVSESFTKTFGFPVRLYWNQRIEEKNSSCAKAGTELTFEEITKKGEQTIYRVRRGKRNFFTTSSALVEPNN